MQGYCRNQGLGWVKQKNVRKVILTGKSAKTEQFLKCLAISYPLPPYIPRRRQNQVLFFSLLRICIVFHICFFVAECYESREKDNPIAPWIPTKDFKMIQHLLIQTITCFANHSKVSNFRVSLQFVNLNNGLVIG